MIQAPTGSNTHYGNVPILEHNMPLVPTKANMLLPDIVPLPSRTRNMAILDGVEIYACMCNPHNSFYSGRHHKNLT